MDAFLQKDHFAEKIHIACFVRKESGQIRHRNRNSFGLALHLAGEKEYVFFSGERIPIQPWEIIFMPKGSDYIVEVREPGECYAINFDLAGNPSLPPFKFSVRWKTRFLEYFKSAAKAWEMKKPGYLAKCRAELYGIISLMQQEYAMGYMQKEKFSRIQPAVEEIHRGYAGGELSVSALSALCGMSPEYFRAIFKQQFGVSPLQYIQNLRITRAKELLVSGLCSVTETAYRSGFADQSHFSRVFKSAVGISPVQYLRGER